MYLSIIIPLYNEQKLVIEVLNRLNSISFPSFVTKHEIIIVNDCSTDLSGINVKDHIRNLPGIRIFDHAFNQGKGAAVRTGISHASGDVFLIQDADLELSPKDIPAMLQAMADLNVQFINGSRYMPGVIRPLSSYKRYLANKLFTFITSVIIDVKLTDIACGYKLIHKDLYHKITLQENRFGFEAELIIKALRIKRNNVAEVPVSYFPRNNGEGKKLQNIDALKILKTILKYGLFSRSN